MRKIVLSFILCFTLMILNACGSSVPTESNTQGTQTMEKTPTDGKENEKDLVNKEYNPIVLYRNDNFREIDYSDKFNSLQNYLDYLGAAANNECIYLPVELNQNIKEVEFDGQTGNFSYTIDGPSSMALLSSDKSIEYVRLGKWKSNYKIEEEQVMDLVDAMDSAYGEHKVDFSDGEVIDEVESQSVNAP